MPPRNMKKNSLPQSRWKSRLLFGPPTNITVIWFLCMSLLQIGGAKRVLFSSYHSCSLMGLAVHISENAQMLFHLFGAYAPYIRVLRHANAEARLGMVPLVHEAPEPGSPERSPKKREKRQLQTCRTLHIWAQRPRPPGLRPPFLFCVWSRSPGGVLYCQYWQLLGWTEDPRRGICALSSPPAVVLYK